MIAYTLEQMDSIEKDHKITLDCTFDKFNSIAIFRDLMTTTEYDRQDTTTVTTETSTDADGNSTTTTKEETISNYTPIVKDGEQRREAREMCQINNFDLKDDTIIVYINASVVHNGTKLGQLSISCPLDLLSDNPNIPSEIKLKKKLGNDDIDYKILLSPSQALKNTYLVYLRQTKISILMGD